MSDSSAVDGAVFSALTDATLAGLLPDGVWRDVAPQGKTKFILFSMPAHEDIDEQNEATPLAGEPAFERFTFMVKAVDKATSSANANTAAARIKTLIRSLPAVITGYHIVKARRTERIAYTETDPDDLDAHWQHRGGLFELLVEPI